MTANSDSKLVLPPSFRKHRRIAVSNLCFVLLLIGLPFLYFIPAVKSEILLAMGDGWSYSILMRVLLGSRLSQGMLPLWNEYTFGGMPFLGAVQPGVFYPFNWLFAFLSPGTAMNLVVITTYHLALIGTYLYMRSLEMSREASLLSGIAFAFGGFMIAHLEQTNYIAAAAWLPWILLAIEKLYRSVSWEDCWKWSSLGAGMIALQTFAGLPQATFQIILVCSPYVIFLLYRRDNGRSIWKGNERYLLGLLAMTICGALLSAVQLLPTRELQIQGERAAISYESFAMFSMPPRRLLTFIVPFFFGGALPSPYQVAGWDHWWLHKYVHAYIGLPAILLALAAVFSGKSKRIVWFWLCLGSMALLLSFGDEMPWNIHRWLYHIPIYNLFRGPYRHTYELTFALAVLAGLGMDSLRARKEATTIRAFHRSAILVLCLMLGVLSIYRYFPDHLSTFQPPPTGGNSLANFEILIPVFFLLLSLLTLWLYSKYRGVLVAFFVIVVAFTDLAFFGWFTYWRTMGSQVLERLHDPPAIKAIKERELDLRSFRIVTYAVNPYDRNYENLSHANLAIARNLQSVSGYDPMRLSRQARLCGKMDIFGFIPETSVFNSSNQGLNLLNVKYLLRENIKMPENEMAGSLKIDGVRFQSELIGIKIGSNGKAQLNGSDNPTNELALISTMTDASSIIDDSPVLKIILHTINGPLIEKELRVGRDTAEWAYDRPDVKATIRHRRAKIAESWSADGFEAHRYTTRIQFPRSKVERVELKYQGEHGNIVIERASLYDSETGASFSLQRDSLSPDRWRKLHTFGEVELYENLKVLPRAWFVKTVTALPEAQVLESIWTGKLPDGKTFDPSETALLEEESLAGHSAEPSGTNDNSNAIAHITNYEPHRVEINTRNSKSGYLVLSETHYPGWEAWIDGIKVPVERVNHILRGIHVPSGEHRITYVYRSASFRTGLVFFMLGLFSIVMGFVIIRYRSLSSQNTVIQDR